MPIQESATVTLEGRYRDVLRDAHGRVVWDRGWHKNAIVVTCRHLLAGFVKGDPPVLGIGGLLVGAGLEAWDQSAPPPATPSTSSLVDANPFKLPKGPALAIDFIDGAMVVPFPTNRLQIAATFGPGAPSWPDANHTTSSLREFGLVGTLNGADVLMNYVTHPVITKDPASTLERTIWLVF